MNPATVFGFAGAALVGLGLFGFITSSQPLRRIVAFNILGNGVFLLFGVVARKGAAAGVGGDPVPQALVITAIVVAFAATAMALALTSSIVDRIDSTAPKARRSPRSATDGVD